MTTETATYLDRLQTWSEICPTQTSACVLTISPEGYLRTWESAPAVAEDIVIGVAPSLRFLTPISAMIRAWDCPQEKRFEKCVAWAIAVVR